MNPQTKVKVYDFPRAYEKVVVSVENHTEPNKRKTPLIDGTQPDAYAVVGQLTQEYSPMARIDMTARTWLLYPRSMLETIADKLNLASPQPAFVGAETSPKVELAGVA